MSVQSATQLRVGAYGVVPKDARVATTIATRSDSVAINVCELLTQALIRHGYTDQESQAGVFRMSRKNFQKQINTNPNYDAYNPILKRLGQVPMDVLREFFALGSEKVGLVIGIQHEQAEAAMRLAESIHHLMKVSAR